MSYATSVFLSQLSFCLYFFLKIRIKYSGLFLTLGSIVNKLRRSMDNPNRLSSLNLWDVSEQDKSLANVFQRYGLCFGHFYAGAKIAMKINLIVSKYYA